MAKSTIESIISDKNVDKIVALVEKMQAASLNHEKVSITKKEENLKNEKERIRKEFNRVCDILEKTDASSSEYRNIAENLNQLKRILDFWYN